jgi:hypothetical protein
MRRVARRVFTLCSAASLLICVAVCALWVRGHFVVARIDVRPTRSERYLAIESVRGETELFSTCVPREVPPFVRYRAVESLAEYDDEGHSRPDGLGFSFKAAHGPRGWAYFVFFPTAVPAIVFALLPCIWLYGRATCGRRWAAGSCIKCGYDLRASPDRCPECGTPGK